MKGARLIAETLTNLCIGHVFGMPGTQNVALYEAMRKAGLRSTTASDEGAAAFMATGYARASGAIGTLTTIPGPGFVYALAGVSEARQDSVPLLWLTLRLPDSGASFQVHPLDLVRMAEPVVKQTLFAQRPQELESALYEAYASAVAGEPGPVLLEIAAELLDQDCGRAGHRAESDTNCPDIEPLVSALSQAQRPLIYAGLGAQRAAELVRELSRRMHAPVLMTGSGRGVISDNDPLAFVQDFSTGIGQVVPQLIDRSDLILVLGCKFTHNGSAGGRLRLPSEKLVRIDSSADVLALNYPARVAIHATVERVMVDLAGVSFPRSRWLASELAGWRERLSNERAQPIELEPIPGGGMGSVRDVFEALHAASRGRAIFVTDAGLHQTLTRRYATVTQPRGLICPSDFQSMGSGLPGAIGAALACPDACVIACIGDGGLALSAGELLTAVREGVDLIVMVFNDGYLNLIRRQQVMRFGHASGVRLHAPDYSLLAKAVGCSYFAVDASFSSLAQEIVESPGVRLVELQLADASSFRLHELRNMVREKIRPIVPPGLLQARKWLRRR